MHRPILTYCPVYRPISNKKCQRCLRSCRKCFCYKVCPAESTDMLNFLFDVPLTASVFWNRCSSMEFGMFLKGCCQYKPHKSGSALKSTPCALWFHHTAELQSAIFGNGRKRHSWKVCVKVCRCVQATHRNLFHFILNPTLATPSDQSLLSAFFGSCCLSLSAGFPCVLNIDSWFKMPCLVQFHDDIVTLQTDCRWQS